MVCDMESSFLAGVFTARGMPERIGGMLQFQRPALTMAGRDGSLHGSVFHRPQGPDPESHRRSSVIASRITHAIASCSGAESFSISATAFSSSRVIPRLSNRGNASLRRHGQGPGGSFGQLDRHEVVCRVQIVSPGLINHPDIPILCGRRTLQHLIDLTRLQVVAAITANAKDKLR